MELNSGLSFEISRRLLKHPDSSIDATLKVRSAVYVDDREEEISKPSNRITKTYTSKRIWHNCNSVRPFLYLLSDVCRK